MSVIQDIKRVESEKSKKEAFFAGSNNQMMQMLSESLNEAQKRKKVNSFTALSFLISRTMM